MVIFWGRLMICLVVVQEFLQSKHAADSVGGVKTKSRGRRQASGTARRCRARGKSARAGYELRSSVPVTLGFGGLSPSRSDGDAARVGPTAAAAAYDLGLVDGKSLMYATRVNSYIARSLTEDGEDDDDSRSPPTLTHAYSLARAPSREPRDPYRCHVKLGKVLLPRSASTRLPVPAPDAVTPPSKADFAICDDSPPVAKRRLFAGSLSSRPDGSADSVGQLSGQNGYHAIEKLFAPSLNGKSLGIVDHYEDGLLAIANAACLMSTGVLDQNRVSETPGR